MRFVLYFLLHFYISIFFQIKLLLTPHPPINFVHEQNIKYDGLVDNRLILDAFGLAF